MVVLFNRRKYMRRRGSPQGAPADLADATITVVDSVQYTGNPVYPSVTVTYEGATLVVNQDYTLNYSDNTNVGAATVVVTGMGEFTGQVVKTFQIVSSGGGGNPWVFDITKTSSDPDASYEISGFGSYAGSRLAAVNGGVVHTPGPATSFNFLNLTTSESATTGGLGNVVAGGVSPDGVHFIILIGNNLSHAVAVTPGDVAGLSFVLKQYGVTFSACRGLVISGDGLHVFAIGMWDYGLQGKLFRHDLSTAFDFSTMSAEHSATISFVGAATAGKYQDFCFAPDGRKMLWFDNATAYVFNLSVAWDPSTATLAGSKTFNESIAFPCVAVDAAGSNLYIGGGGKLRVFSLTA